MADRPNAAAITKFMQQQKLIDMNTSLGSLMEMTVSTGIDEVAGYVVAWEKYVLVVGADLDIREISQR